MLLDLGKAACFLLCLRAVGEAAVSALFVPGAPWQERLLMAGFRLGIAAWICLISGILFTLPLRANPDRGRPLSATLPVRLFLWSSACIAALFLVSWYLADLMQQASPFISDRTLRAF